MQFHTRRKRIKRLPIANSYSDGAIRDEKLLLNWQTYWKMDRFSGQCSKIFSKIWEQRQNSRRQEGNMNKVPYWVTTKIRRHSKKFSRHGDLAPSICTPCLKGNVASTMIVIWVKELDQHDLHLDYRNYDVQAGMQKREDAPNGTKMKEWYCNVKRGRGGKNNYWITNRYT
jgi:hypothetical protein